MPRENRTRFFKDMRGALDFGRWTPGWMAAVKPQTRGAGSLRSFHGGVNLALRGQPGHVSPPGVLLDLAKELNRFRLVAQLAPTIDRDDHLDLDRNDILRRLNQAGPLDSLSGNTHG
jgi:hypothetical protein